MKFSRLTVIRVVVPSSRETGPTKWECQCDCGNTSFVQINNLTNGRTKSCGCLGLENTIARSTTHGEAARHHKSKEVRVWNGMKSRCLNPNNPKYKDYGATGITVDPSWVGRDGFITFLRDMGRCPPNKKSIDRIDGTKGYFKENCRWADDYDQANNQKTNRRITFRGETLTINQWTRKLGMKMGTLWQRLNHGWPIERAMTEKTNNNGNRYGNKTVA